MPEMPRRSLWIAVPSRSSAHSHPPRCPRLAYAPPRLPAVCYDRGSSAAPYGCIPYPLIVEEQTMADSLPYTHLYTDDAGVTHFTNAALPWQSSHRGTPPMPRWTTAFQDARSVGYVRAGTGYVSDWHPAPRKQFAIVLAGMMAVEAGDGDTRVFTPGMILLVTDLI